MASVHEDTDYCTGSCRCRLPGWEPLDYCKQRLETLRDICNGADALTLGLLLDHKCQDSS